MSELESNSSQASPGGKNESPSMQTYAQELYSIPHIKTLPEFNFQSYLKFVEPLGHEVEVKTGIFHLVPMIQSAHESANGNSGLARKHGNLFGFKATKAWKDAGHLVADMPTWEVMNGKRVDLNQEFRGYPNWRDSFMDWGRLISTLSVYKKAYGFLKDKGTVPEGLEAMALIYATDPAYARKLRLAYEHAIQAGIA